MQYITIPAEDLFDEKTVPVHVSGTSPRDAVMNAVQQKLPDQDVSSILDLEEVTSNNGIWCYGSFIVLTLH